MPKSHFHVGVIGCGLRSTAYFRNLPEALRSRVSIAAVADPSETNRSFFADRFGHAGTKRFSDYRQLLKERPLDAVIISSPNAYHEKHIIAALQLNVPLLVEKPVGITVTQCRNIWRAYQASKRPQIAVGFVLRYTPYYRKIMEIIQSGVLGQILQVDADELLGPSLTSVFFRDSWRINSKATGGLLVEKCCHDFDVLALAAGAPAKRVFSLAARTHFIPRPRSEQHRRFDASVTRRMALDYGDVHIKRFFESTSDTAVYNRNGDVPDHQAVVVEYENQVLTAFTVAFGQPRQTRRIRVMGSNGSLVGDIQNSSIEYDVAHKTEDRCKRHTIKIKHDKSGHSGGDSHINEAFWNAVVGKPSTVRAGLKEGLEAVLTAICAEKSKRTGRAIDVSQARAAVFSPDRSSRSNLATKAKVSRQLETRKRRRA